MDKPAIPGKNLPWAGKKVRPTEIEEQLTSLWHLAADNMRISQNMNVRTSVLNLIICTLDTHSAYRLSSLLREIPNTHIARVVLLILDMRDGAPSEAATWVTLRSFPVISDIMRHHFEQVTVRLSGSAIRSAATIVQPMLKPDLPTYLWWTSNLPADFSVFQHLLTISNRAIVDSSDFTPPTERILPLPSLVQQTPTCALSDLNWSRVTPWRELVAQFFDVAEYRSYLVNVETVEIEHAVSAGEEPSQDGKPIISPNPIRALFLAAWLKTRLGWQRSEDDSYDFADASTGTYRWQMTKRVPTTVLTGPLVKNIDTHRTIGGLEIIIRPRVQTTLRPGNICLVRATGTYERKQAVFTIDRGQDDQHVTTSVTLPGSSLPPRIVDMTATQKESELLNDELEIMGHDQLYEKMLQEVFALLKVAEE